MKKIFNRILFVTIPLLIFAVFVGEHYLDSMSAPIEAMKQIGGNIKMEEYLYELEDTYDKSYYIIISTQILSVIALLGVVFLNQRFNKILDEHEHRVQEAEENLEKHEKELRKAYDELERANQIAERNTKYMTMVQKAGTLQELTDSLITELSKDLNASQGAFFVNGKDGSKNYTKMVSSFAYSIPESSEVSFEFGEGLVGQVAKEGNTLYMEDLPEGHVEIVSGLGSSEKANLIIVPIKSDASVLGVIELASFHKLKPDDKAFLENISQNVGTKLSVLIK